MSSFAQALIATLGGSTAVSRLIDAPNTTVQSWKHNGIPSSRLAHLKLVAEKEDIAIDWTTGLARGKDDAPTSQNDASTAAAG